ncbi:hypothetical protein AKJ48_01600 [candidate division MSBL1 archaeon SCGC-AAA261O19]|uniref:Three-Cys-motif partner protein TcmP n=1 Tax=candidate division MSBL1 archaeon SCGC-AAA261O19 TaxID=1698277 RepID=A0A133VE57_9EURY|nr:hypothetical protein AKJ48_01600 [candidate division MSBL1 archaeon SCGC-AAA261O19]
MKVKLHSKLKHKIISYYFSSGWRNVFKSGKFYSLYYVDLFAGDGYCECSDLDEELEGYLPDDLSKRKWEPPFFNLMKFANDSDVSLRCIFNDKETNKIESLVEEIEKKGYSRFLKAWFDGDANIVFKSALDIIRRPNRPSLFFLDPTNHKQLKFSTVEGIANFEDEKTGRKPELIINFMIHSILMSLKRGLKEEDVKSINNFLGTDFDREEILKITKDKSEKTHKSFLRIFLNNLGKLGYHCNWHLIKSVKTQSPIYYLIFATHRDDIQSWYAGVNFRVEKLEEEWVKKNYIIKTMSEAKKEGQRFLHDFSL